MDMRTPLGKVRGLGSAKDGTDHFWRQRVTAVANVPLMLFFIGFVIKYNGAPYEEVVGALSNPIVAVVMGGYLRSLTDRAREGKFSTWPMIMALLRSKLDRKASTVGKEPDLSEENGRRSSGLTASDALLRTLGKSGPR